MCGYESEDLDQPHAGGAAPAAEDLISATRRQRRAERRALPAGERARGIASHVAVCSTPGRVLHSVLGRAILARTGGGVNVWAERGVRT